MNLTDIVFWHWWGLGGVLLALEVAAPGVFFLWVAIGAVVAGFVALIFPMLGWESESLIMMVVAVASALLGRRSYYKARGSRAMGTLNRRGARAIGRVITLEEPIVNGAGRVRLDGTHWAVSGPDAPAGALVKVIGSDGTVLKVELA